MAQESIGFILLSIFLMALIGPVFFIALLGFIIWANYFNEC